MRFVYEYRSSDNVRHSGIVVASDREAAFQKLKREGIRPGKMSEAPGMFNKLFGKGKRWIAICVLGGFCAVLCVVALNYSREEDAVRFAMEDRAQVFGDPAVMQKISKDGWRATFSKTGDAWFARHAIPGKLCDCDDAITNEGPEWRKKMSLELVNVCHEPLEIIESDPDEIKKMKRMVNGMKQEFSAYVENPNDAIEYIAKACERCRIEKRVYENLRQDILMIEKALEKEGANKVKLISEWDRKNVTLRSMGLPTFAIPDEE